MKTSYLTDKYRIKTTGFIFLLTIMFFSTGCGHKYVNGELIIESIEDGKKVVSHYSPIFQGNIVIEPNVFGLDMVVDNKWSNPCYSFTKGSVTSLRPRLVWGEITLYAHNLSNNPIRIKLISIKCDEEPVIFKPVTIDVEPMKWKRCYIGETGINELGTEETFTVTLEYSSKVYQIRIAAKRKTWDQIERLRERAKNENPREFFELE